MDLKASIPRSYPADLVRTTLKTKPVETSHDLSHLFIHLRSLVTGAIYLFFTVVLLSWWVIMPHALAGILIAVAIILLIHIGEPFQPVSLAQ